MKTEREVAALIAVYEARLEERRVANIEAKALLHAQVEILQSHIAMLKDELRRAQMGAQEVINSAFLAVKVPPPHQAPRGERGPMRQITPNRTWDQARVEAEAKELRPPNRGAEQEIKEA